MGSLSLPVIDFSKENLTPGSTSWIQRQKEVRKALEEFGCFHAHYETVPLEAHKKIYGALEDWFNLPKETKMKNCVTEDDVAGYSVFPGGEGMMVKDDNPFFGETIYSYKHELEKLEKIVKRMILESFGLEKYYESFLKSTYYFLGGNAYSPQVNESEIKSMREHTDSGFLTILHQNGVHGLQIKTKDGQWIELTPSPTSFTVMIGDSFVAWSNGRLHSPVHCVVLKGSVARYSVIVMSNATGMVETPKELVDEEHPALFKPFYPTDLVRLCYPRERTRYTTVWDHFAV